MKRTTARWGLGVRTQRRLDSVMRSRIPAVALLPLLLASPVSAQSPPRQSMPFDQSRVRAAPGPAVRHAVVAGLPPLPVEGVTIELPCAIAWSNGGVAICVAPDDSPAARAALALAQLYNFDMSGIGRTSERPLVDIAIPVRLSEADRRPLDFLTQPRLDIRLIGFTRTPTADMLTPYYPAAALRQNVETGVTMTCQIQSDLSVFCARPSIETAGLDASLVSRLAVAALQITSFLRVEPVLTDGRRAVGVVFNYDVHFRIPGSK